LEVVIRDVSTFKERNAVHKLITSLKLYQPGFREKFRDALAEFYFHMIAQHALSDSERDAKLEEIKKEIDELRVTRLAGTLI
jgi:hypothetical protein